MEGTFWCLTSSNPLILMLNCSFCISLYDLFIPAEDTLNIALREITVTARDGRVSQLEQVYIRGSMVRFIIVPDLLAQAPMCVPSFLFISPPSLFIVPIIISG